MDQQRKLAIIQRQIDAVADNGLVADVDVKVWAHQNEVAVRTTLGIDNPTYKKLVKVGFSPRAVWAGMGQEVYDRALRSGIQNSVALLTAAISEIELLNDLTGTPQPAKTPELKAMSTPSTTEATVIANTIEIVIHDDIYEHIRQYLANDDYFHAVEESYKVVREKLRELTGEEKASEVFSQNGASNKYYGQLFGTATPSSMVEADFFRGVGYLHLGVQFLRNEKAHTPAQALDPNLAVHYISLASLAYDLISQHAGRESIRKVEESITAKRHGYRTSTAFYNDFNSGSWIEGFHLPSDFHSRTVRKAARIKWLDDVDFTRSWDHSNIVLMRLQLVAEELTSEDLDKLLDEPITDSHGRHQEAGLHGFMLFMQQRFPGQISSKVGAWIASKNS